MPWLIVVFGILLVIGGGASVVHGYPYIQLEFGWTEVIAGTTAATGGILTIALAAVLFSLAALRRSIERGGGAMPIPLRPAPPSASSAEPAQGPVLSTWSLDRPPGASEADGAATAPRFDALGDRPAVQPPTTLWSVGAPSTLAHVADATPAVAGRYESGGSSYVLFTDGTIEVDSETGKHRFGSMEDLKSFMAKERREGVETEPVP